VERLANTLQIHPQLAAVLWSRGLHDRPPSHFDPPLALSAIPDLTLAAARLVAAIEGGKRIRIHGDYDADGISGTAVLTLGLRALGAYVTPFIPHRLQDGYGIHPRRVPEHAAASDLLLTVDCGISNLQEIEALQRAGVEVIVSDHHTPGERQPDCLVVHPRRSPLATAGLPELTGAGVAYHLLWAVHRQLRLADPIEFADLATIGTIADVAPLMGENRALVKLGLQQLARSAWPGVRAALELARVRGAPSARDVAFVLAPRLNAAGRLGEAELALRLLTLADEREALAIAAQLEAHNRERRRVQDAMLESALTRVDPGAPAIVIADDAWHPGVMGLVASALVERYHKPVFIAAQGKGSVRSTPGISAVAGLAAAQAHLQRWGGHAMAAGFALDMQHFEQFRAHIEAYVASHPTPIPTVIADGLLDPGQLDRELFDAICDLEPFGEGHRAPRFLMRAPLASGRAVGTAGQTLQLRLQGRNGDRPKGVAFRRGALAEHLLPGDAIDVLAELTLNEWQGSETVEFQAAAVRAAAGVVLGDEQREFAPPPPVALRSEDPQGVRIDPEASDPLATVRERYRAGGTFALTIGPRDEAAIREALATLPTIAQVRETWVALARGLTPGVKGRALQRTLTILGELGLVDGNGNAVRGVKVPPYRSPQLLRSLTQRYTLSTLLVAYEQLDDHTFDATLRALAEVD
jgi:single-stranded-DNA-specific exonuclease